MEGRMEENGRDRRVKGEEGKRNGEERISVKGEKGKQKGG